MKPQLLLLLAASACGGGSDRAELASLSFEPPPTWQRTDSHARGSAIAVYVPTANPRRESVTIIRTEVGAIATRYSSATLAQLLAGAQSALRDARTSAISPITTDSGLAGLQIVVDYLPPGATQPYHRVHAVLADGTALVHLVYTAATPDPDLAAFRQVLATLREES